MIIYDYVIYIYIFLLAFRARSSPTGHEHELLASLGADAIAPRHDPGRPRRRRQDRDLPEGVTAAEVPHRLTVPGGRLHRDVDRRTAGAQEEDVVVHLAVADDKVLRDRTYTGALRCERTRRGTPGKSTCSWKCFTSWLIT